MNKILLKLRELVWPLLEVDDNSEVSDQNLTAECEASEVQTIIKIEEENLDLALQLQGKIYQEEEDRRKGTESKAALFIGSLSLANTIVIGANTLIWGKDIPNGVIKISVLISVILAIYTLRTVWFSIKVLERGIYHVLGNDDINIPGDKNKFKREILLIFFKIIKGNEDIINMKVSNLVMAQEYYKRAMFVICLYAFMVFYFCFFL
ncbi:hypothetical protein [Chryseobacterium sp. SIMBA_029]|uniref:hypothetical protein n=1 Tax=Chryseobacterium sp. SIMBA_029 TaxID=3085772 RepID=UPI00397ABBA4